MGYEPYSQNVSRYGRTFDALDPNAFIAPFFFMKANTTGVAGDLVQYETTEDTVGPAVSGILLYNVAGFLMQDVKDLDAGAVRGWRNPNNSVEHLGGSVGVLQSNGPAMTKRYVGTPAIGTRLTSAKDGRGKLETYHATQNTGDAVAVVEAVVSSDTPTVEPAQFTGTAAPDFIRIRIYGL